jgi:methyl-accepting chemotaxis protein
MSTTSKLKVSTRLASGFGVLLLLLAMLAILGLVRLNSFHDRLTHISNDRLPKLVAGNGWLIALEDTSRHTRNMLIMDDATEVRKEIDAVEAELKLGSEYTAQLQKSVNSARDKEALQKALDARAVYQPLEKQFVDLIEVGDKAGAKDLLLQTMRPRQRELVTALKQFGDMQVNLMQSSQQEAAAEYGYSRALLIAISTISLVVGVLAACLITRSILRQLGGEPEYAASVVNRIAHGDLAMHIQLQSGDQSSLLFSLKKMRDDLRLIVANVRQGTDTIATASGQIAAGNQDLSSRTEQQAASLEETASSMEELTSTVKQNADNARQASNVAASAVDVAGQGGMVVSQVVQTMGEINESAKKIVDIISVIDGIAFQTNILALNAAVEAARAGEQGRGFAVVASEVRNLAQRSATAAKEIKVLIHDSVEKVEAGSRLVDQAGSTMDQVVASVRHVTDIIGEITAASAEQSAGIEQINQAISGMDNVTQQNAALVEQAAAAAGSLQDQARTLAQVVSVFKLAASTDIWEDPKPAPKKVVRIDQHRAALNRARLNAPGKLNAGY